MHGTGNYAILWVCLDCMFARESGETNSEEPEFEPWSKLAAGEHEHVSMGLYSEDHSDDCTPADRENGCTCERDTLSRRSCDGCGNNYDGERHAYTLEYDRVPPVA